MINTIHAIVVINMPVFCEKSFFCDGWFMRGGDGFKYSIDGRHQQE